MPRKILRGEEIKSPKWFLGTIEEEKWNEVDTPLSKPSLCFLLARRSSLQLGNQKTNDMWRRGSVAEPRGRNVFAVRITSLHMELVSYMLSEAWILSPEGNYFLRPRQLQLVKCCLL